MKSISSINELDEIYNKPSEIALWKELDHIDKYYQQFIEKAPFLVLSTYGENGLDCSPRGDAPGFVRVLDEQYIQIPDRKGNNRLDSLKNIIANPDVGIIFLIPGIGETIRVSGKAKIIVDSRLCESFAVNNKPASSVLSVKVEKAFFQCQKAIARSKLWQPSSLIQRSELPSTGTMIKHFADNRNVDFDAKEYDESYPEHMKKTIY